MISHIADGVAGGVEFISLDRVQITALDLGHAGVPFALEMRDAALRPGQRLRALGGAPLGRGLPIGFGRGLTFAAILLIELLAAVLGAARPIDLIEAIPV